MIPTLWHFTEYKDSVIPREYLKLIFGDDYMELFTYMYKSKTVTRYTKRYKDETRLYPLEGAPYDVVFNFLRRKQIWDLQK